MMELKDITTFEQLDTLLGEGKISEEEYHDLWNALKGGRPKEKTPGAIPDNQAVSGKGFKLGPLSARETAVVLLCTCFQIAGLVCVIVGVPVVPGIAGFAAIVAYILAPPELKFAKRFALIGAICGAGLIIYTILTTA